MTRNKIPKDEKKLKKLKFYESRGVNLVTGSL